MHVETKSYVIICNLRGFIFVPNRLCLSLGGVSPVEPESKVMFIILDYFKFTFKIVRDLPVSYRLILIPISVGSYHDGYFLY